MPETFLIAQAVVADAAMWYPAGMQPPETYYPREKDLYTPKKEPAPEREPAQTE